MNVLRSVISSSVQPSRKQAAQPGLRRSRAAARAALQRLAHGGGHGHDVGVRLLLDLDLHRLALAQPGDHLAIGPAGADPAQVAQPHVPPARARHDQIGDLLHRAELVDRAHEVLGVAFLDVAAGEIDVLHGEAARHLLDRQPGPAQLLLVDLDRDLLLQAAQHAHRGHAGHLLQPPLQLLLGEGAQPLEPLRVLVLLAIGGQGEPDHRLQRRVVAQDQRLARRPRAGRRCPAARSPPARPGSSRCPR